MTLGLYQTSLSGHHGAYAKAIALAAAERSWSVKIIIPEEAGKHAAMADIAGIVGTANIIYSPVATPKLNRYSRLALLEYHFSQHRAASRSIALAKRVCDFIYVPTLDQIDQAVRVLGMPSSGIAMGGMCMRIRFHLQNKRSAMSGLKLSLGEAYLRSLVSRRRLTCLTTADPILATYCKGRSGTLRKVRYVPEIGMEAPAVNRRHARESLQLAEQDRVILVYGAITRRKAIAALVSAIESTAFEVPVKILVVGELSADMQSYFSSDRVLKLMDEGTLILKPGFADDHLQALAFSASDAVWVSYLGHETMSGVFYQAVCSGVPVIAPNYGVMHLLAAKHAVGPSVDPQDAVSTGAKIKQLLEDLDTWQSYSRNAAALGSAHRPLSFGRGVCDAIAVSS